MNSSEIKKVTWCISSIILFGLFLSIIDTYQKSNVKEVELTKYIYDEPTLLLPNFKNKNNINEILKVFGSSVLIPEHDPDIRVTNFSELKKPINPRPEYPIKLYMLMGNLAFIQFKADKKITGYLINNEIIDSHNIKLGILKEIHGYYVVIMKDNISKKLYIDESTQLEKEHSNKLELENYVNAQKVNHMETKFGNHSHIQKTSILRKYKTTVQPTDTSSYSHHNFNGVEFRLKKTTDQKGVTHIKVPIDYVKSLQTKSFKEIFLNTSNYSLNYLKKGILVKSINNPEIKKLFHAFGIQQNDILTRINGQSLGNKSVDDILDLYQQIDGTAKYVTIELLKQGKNFLKLNVSIDTIKQGRYK
ncbi:MAG: hypothetical protein COA79_02970 [Planctomycetota bacterium]|nr:MAG: hypothetical protein COA79_02970 [Planctomycetota bacterium]